MAQKSILMLISYPIRIAFSRKDSTLIGENIMNYLAIVPLKILFFLDFGTKYYKYTSKATSDDISATQNQPILYNRRHFNAVVWWHNMDTAQLVEPFLL